MVRDYASDVAAKEFPFLVNSRRTVLVTAHRRENHGEPLLRICQAVSRLVEQQPGIQVVWPVHPNPNVSEMVHGYLGQRDRIHLVKPVGYCSFIGVIALSTLVLTDSGGVQEEAPALGKPVLVLRDTTQRSEGISAGTVKLVGTCEAGIVKEALRILTSDALYRRMSQAICPYGDGQAAERTVAAILSHYGLDSTSPNRFLRTVMAPPV